MTTDEEKSRIARILDGLEVPETKIPERCSDLVKDFHQKFDQEIEQEEPADISEVYENPYKVDRKILEENERKLKELLLENKRAKKQYAEGVINSADPKRPWRTNSNKEKLLRIDCELKQHNEKSSQLITPLGVDEMKELVQECRQEGSAARPVSCDRLRDTVEAARKNLPNFQYREVVNSTATDILAEAHELESSSSGKYIPRPRSKRCFLRSLGELRNLRVLALEYSHIADETGGALISLLPVLKRPHFRLQLMCREDQTPGHTDTALGGGGYGIPDTAWRRVTIACPDLYVLMIFFRIRDYDNIRRFLSPSIPLRETHLQLGIDLNGSQRQDSDISCFVRHIAHFYANTLVTLSIHQWRAAVFPLRRVFELMPRLVRFHYIGRVEDEVDLKRMLNIISCGVCVSLKHVKIQIQDETSRRDYWQRVTESLNKDYSEIMKLYDINLCISIYKS